VVAGAAGWLAGAPFATIFRWLLHASIAQPLNCSTGCSHCSLVSRLFLI
jgi:hypothetical protein